MHEIEVPAVFKLETCGWVDRSYSHYSTVRDTQIRSTEKATHRYDMLMKG